MTDGITAMIKIVSFLMTRQGSMPFRTPVRWREMGLHDYPLKVSRPMDLGTVKWLLEENSYRAVAEVAEDIRRVWSNCMSYNDKGSELHRAAQLLSARFDVSHSHSDSGGGGVPQLFWVVVVVSFLLCYRSDIDCNGRSSPLLFFTRFSLIAYFVVIFTGAVFKACETTGG